MATKTLNTIGLIKRLNKQLEGKFPYKLDIVDPKRLIPAKENARYMGQETMKQLIDNIRQSGGMESIPLCNKQSDKYYIISGHHRIEAATRANVNEIMIMYIEIDSKDDLISKQLSHNALSGQDDPVLLKHLFDSIEDIQAKISSGLQDTLENISFTSINFKVGGFKEFVVLFLPDEAKLIDSEIDEMVQQMSIKPKSTVRVDSIDNYKRFGEAIRRIKKVDNIKSNGMALKRMVEIAMKTMPTLKQENEVNKPKLFSKNGTSKTNKKKQFRVRKK